LDRYVEPRKRYMGLGGRVCAAQRGPGDARLVEDRVRQLAPAIPGLARAARAPIAGFGHDRDLPDPAISETWPEPDFAVLRQDRLPPRLPITAFGPAWAEWIMSAAEAAACPPDYVAAPLLATSSALIGNARWAEATPG
jgi:hypothetical protein